MPRTSETHPLKIASVSTGSSGGEIGITLCPGKKQLGALSGDWARDLDIDLDAIMAWGAAAVVSVIEEHELHELDVSSLGEGVTKRHMTWLHLPVADYSVPDQQAEGLWREQSAGVRHLLRNGFKVLFHCKGGLGRSGMMAARTLVELGWDPNEAIKEVRRAREGAIETLEQERVVKGAQRSERNESKDDEAGRRDRAVGALLGLAVGDALGTTLEFSRRDSKPPVLDLVGGGPFRLEPGEWTDDTAMALALAESLLENDGLNENDLMDRFVSWWLEGTYSCNGRCFDIGNTTSAALDLYRASGNPIAGDTEPDAAGNGSLMRLAPVALRYWNDTKALDDVAARQSRCTHGALEAVDACRAYALLLSEAIKGQSADAILAPRQTDFAGDVSSTLAGSWRGLSREDVRSGGYVIESLEAALWAVGRTTTFKDAVILAANLGRDADTVAAIAGQLAGAIYGASSIPATWLERLAWAERLRTTAEGLFESGSKDR